MATIKADSQSQEKLRFLVFGAGAIGTYIGGSLALQGHPVVFLEKPEVAVEIARRGLGLRLGEQEFRLPSPILSTSFEQAFDQGPFDAGLIAVKSYDTPKFLESLQPHIGWLPPVLCLQNGVENEALLAERLGAEKVIAGTVTSAIGRTSPGEVILERLRGIGIAASHPLSPRLVQSFNQAGLNARLYPSAPAMKWSKMLTNLLANASSAILDMNPGEIFAHAGLYRLEIAQLREALSVMRALDIAVVDLPATPVRLLAFFTQRLPPALSRPLLKQRLGSGRGGKMPSLHIDLHSGRSSSEVDSLNGAVVRFGQATGIQTPVNRLLNDTLLEMTRGAIPLAHFSRQPEKLLALWERSG